MDEESRNILACLTALNLLILIVAKFVLGFKIKITIIAVLVCFIPFIGAFIVLILNHFNIAFA